MTKFYFFWVNYPFKQLSQNIDLFTTVLQRNLNQWNISKQIWIYSAKWTDSLKWIKLSKANPVRQVVSFDMIWSDIQHERRPTCRVVGTRRFKPSMQMLTPMLIPAKRRLLFPMIDWRVLLVVYNGQQNKHLEVTTFLRFMLDNKKCQGQNYSFLSYFLLPCSFSSRYNFTQPVDCLPVFTRTHLQKNVNKSTIREVLQSYIAGKPIINNFPCVSVWPQCENKWGMSLSPSIMLIQTRSTNRGPYVYCWCIK